jgi:uncharacterized protein (DUF58 family)
MNPKLYRIYRYTAQIKKRIRSKVSPAGRLFLLMTGTTVLFGLNTRETMLYQIGASSLALLLVSLPLSFFFSTKIRVRRILPESCTAGEKLSYLLQLENRGKKSESGLYFTESSGSDYPSFSEFDRTPELGEKERNRFDRKFGYYRWLWLLERKIGARFKSLALPAIAPGEQLQAEVSFLPLRRGYIHLGGYSIHRHEPLGLFKKEIFFRDEEKLLVLPRMYPVIRAEFSGSRKYHQGGLVSASSCGDSGEFVSLREYRAGDPVKHIDWKATAKTGTTIVRQYQDEYFSRYGILLDTFSGDLETSALEDAISVAASIIVQQDPGDNVIELLLAGDNCISTISMGRGTAVQRHMLEVLACMSSCRTKEFTVLTEIVMGHANVLSGLILILLEIDKERQKLIRFLESNKIPHKIILISTDKEKSKEQLNQANIQNVVIFDMNSKTQVVDLS